MIETLLVLLVVQTSEPWKSYPLGNSSPVEDPERFGHAMISHGQEAVSATIEAAVAITTHCSCQEMRKAVNHSRYTLIPTRQPDGLERYILTSSSHGVEVKIEL